jgi:hypothetical protein
MHEIEINNPFRVGHKYFKFQISNFKLFISNPFRVGRPPRRTCDHIPSSSSLPNNQYSVRYQNLKFQISNIKYLNPVRGVIIVEKGCNIFFKPCRGDTENSPNKIPSAFFASRRVGMEGYGFSRGVGYQNFKFQISNFKLFKSKPIRVGLKNFKFQISNFKLFISKPIRVGLKNFKFEISNFKLFISNPFRVGRPPRRTCDHIPFGYYINHIPSGSHLRNNQYHVHYPKLKILNSET